MKLAYTEFEPVNGSNSYLSPLIFLHGITHAKEHWDNIPQIIADATRRKAYALDARNHGRSERSEEFHFRFLVKDLFCFMEDMNIPKAVIVGHSMGGQTAYKTALIAPQRVEMLFVEEMFVRKVPQAFFDYFIPAMKVWKKIEPSIPKGADKEEVFNFITENVIRSTQPHVVLRKEDFQNRRDTFYALHKDSYGNYCFSTNLDVIIKETQTADLLQFDTEPESTYTGPTYFIYGTKSYFHVDKEKDHIRSHFPRVEFFAFEGAKHELHRQFPDEFAATVINCIKKNESLHKL